MKVFPAIVTVPVRFAPELFVATMKEAVPLPFPGPALITATHATLLTVVHAHVDPVVTVLLPEPPAEVNDRVVGEMDMVHPVGALCVTANVVPAIVRLPVRLVVPVLAATLNPTVPEPEPDAPLVRVIQEVLLLADQAHPDAAVTVLLPVPPSSANVAVVGETLNVQLAADWLTLNVVPAIVSDPFRLVVAVFAATLNPALPDPEPDAPLVTVIHDALLLAFHAQPAPAVTALVPVPPAAVNVWLVGEML